MIQEMAFITFYAAQTATGINVSYSGIQKQREG